MDIFPEVIEGNILVILYYLSSLIGEVSCIEGNILVILYYLSSLLGGMSSIEGNILVILYYLSTSEIWPDKRASLWVMVRV
jgi:hypothetical protein